MAAETVYMCVRMLSLLIKEREILIFTAD